MVAEQKGGIPSPFTEFDAEKSYLLGGLYRGVHHVFRAFERDLELSQQDPQAFRCLLLKEGFDFRGEASGLLAAFLGTVYQQAAHTYFNNKLIPRSDYVVNPSITGILFKFWRQEATTPRTYGIPDGVILRRSMDVTLICGFVEYSSLNRRRVQEITHDKFGQPRKLSQSRSLEEIADVLLEGQGTDQFISHLGKLVTVPGTAPNQRISFIRPEEFRLSYVLPKSRSLPPEMISSRIDVENIPIYMNEAVEITKWMVGDYFGLDIDPATGRFVEPKKAA